MHVATAAGHQSSKTAKISLYTFTKHATNTASWISHKRHQLFKLQFNKNPIQDINAKWHQILQSHKHTSTHETNIGLRLNLTLFWYPSIYNILIKIIQWNFITTVKKIAQFTFQSNLFCVAQVAIMRQTAAGPLVEHLW